MPVCTLRICFRRGRVLDVKNGFRLSGRLEWMRRFASKANNHAVLGKVFQMVSTLTPLAEPRVKTDVFFADASFSTKHDGASKENTRFSKAKNRFGNISSPVRPSMVPTVVADGVYRNDCVVLTTGKDGV